jgi:hypothetical protein
MQAMTKKKLLDDIKARPGRFYRLPGDVLRDRRFDDGERLEILQAWFEDTDPTRAAEIRDIIAELERRATPKNQAAE